MVPAKKSKARGSEMSQRKHIAVKLTSEELRELRRIALDRNSSSVDVVTEALRELIRRQQSQRK